MEVLVSRGTRRHEENEKAFMDLGSGFEEMNDYFFRFPHLIE